LTKQAEKVTTNVCQKADGSCFLGEVRCSECEIHATSDDNNVRNVLENTKKLRRAIQNKRRGKLTSGVVLLRANVLPHTAARTRALLEHFSWELFDHPPYSPDVAQSDYHLFTYLKNWLRSQRFKDEELREVAKTWLSLQVADFFNRHTKTCSSI
jgi:transposase